MTKQVDLDQINKAIVDLTSTKSDKQLHKLIVETAKKLVGAHSGKLLITNRDRVQKVYFSHKLIKTTFLTYNKLFNRQLVSKKLFTLTDKELQKMRIKQFPREIKLLVVVPLTYTQQTLGFIFLFFNGEKKDLSLGEKELLIMYSHITTLALSKIMMQIESQNALEIRDRFISLASHELRTPLTSIHGYIQLLHTRMKKKQSVESRWVKELYIESARMTQLVKELLDVNRIKQGQFAFVFSEVLILEVIRRAIARYQLTNANHPFDFQCKLNNHQIRVVGDFDKLVEMTSGLLGNAVKFSKPGEEITIILKNTVNTVSLTVNDTGKGISKKDLSAIFNGFYKSPDTSHLEGMGVGLLLAKYIIDNHRGKLKIKSKENRGTAVTVILPAIRKND